MGGLDRIFSGSTGDGGGADDIDQRMVADFEADLKPGEREEIERIKREGYLNERTPPEKLSPVAQLVKDRELLEAIRARDGVQPSPGKERPKLTFDGLHLGSRPKERRPKQRRQL